MNTIADLGCFEKTNLAKIDCIQNFHQKNPKDTNLYLGLTGYHG